MQPVLDLVRSSGFGRQQDSSDGCLQCLAHPSLYARECVRVDPSITTITITITITIIIIATIVAAVAAVAGVGMVTVVARVPAVIVSLSFLCCVAAAVCKSPSSKQQQQGFDVSRHEGQREGIHAHTHR